MAGLALLLFAVPIRADTAASFSPIDKSSLGRSGEVFDLDRGEAAIGLHAVKRIELSAEAAVLALQNGGNWMEAPSLQVEVFDRYGLRLGVFDADFRDDPIMPGEQRVKEYRFAVADLASVFKSSSVRLPPDWRDFRFVRVMFFTEALGGPIRGGASPTETKDPRLRPEVEKGQPVRPAIFEENKFGTANIRATAFDPKWSKHGDYLQALIEMIQLNWEHAVSESLAVPTAGTQVTVKFKIDRHGQIAGIVDVQGTAGDRWKKVCTSAITNAIVGDFYKWNDAMIADLGKSQEITLVFYYQ